MPVSDLFVTKSRFDLRSLDTMSQDIMLTWLSWCFSLKSNSIDFSLLVMQVISLAVASTKCLGENLTHCKELHSCCLL